MNQKNRASEFLLLNFTPAEVNALTAMALRMYANNKKVSDPPVYAVWNTDGTLNTECSIKYAGVYFNIYTRLVPSVSGGKIHLQIINCRLGKLPLSAKMAEKAVNSRLNEEICKDKRLQKSLSLIYSLQAEKSGEVQVKILRKNSGKLLKSIF